MNFESSLDAALDETGRSFGRIVESLRAPVVVVSFWLAVALPFLYVPLLFATGLQTPTETAAFVALLLANVVTLLVGHSYNRNAT
ncbi:MAG: hypothetical protein ABEI96_07115 [Haloarculaceae archaeon]